MKATATNTPESTRYFARAIANGSVIQPSRNVTRFTLMLPMTAPDDYDHWTVIVVLDIAGATISGIHNVKVGEDRSYDVYALDMGLREVAYQKALNTPD